MVGRHRQSKGYIALSLSGNPKQTFLVPMAVLRAFPRPKFLCEPSPNTAHSHATLTKNAHQAFQYYATPCQIEVSDQSPTYPRNPKLNEFTILAL